MTDAFDVEAYLEQVTQKKEEKNNRDDRRSSRDRERDRDRDRESDRRRRRSVSRSRSTDRRDRERDRDSRDRRRRRDSRSRKGRSRSRSRSLGRKRERDRERDADDDKSKREKSAERKRLRDEEVVKDREEEKKKREIDDLTKDQRTIFVSQLTKKVSERDLEKFFGQLGKVKSVIMLRDKFTGAHKGFAYVEMDDLETIPNCLLFHNVVPDFQKFPILVKASEAEKNFLAKKDPFNIKNSSSLKEGPDSRIYLGNINVTLDESALQVVLEQFGPVESIKLHRDHLGNSKGFAFVKFEKHDSASLALQTLAGFELAGRPLKVGPVIDAKAALDPSAVGSTGFVDPSSNANWKLDADEGNSGVSLNSQSRMILMAKLGQAAGIEVPIAAVPQTPAPIIQSNAIPGIPSRTILVKNMFDPATETEPNWSQDIREDVSEECSNFGQLDTVYVEAVKPGGLVYIKMKSVEGATKAAISLNGRFFAGRQISVMYIEESVFQTAISS